MHQSYFQRFPIILFLLLFPDISARRTPEFKIGAPGKAYPQLLDSPRLERALSLSELNTHLRRFGYMSSPYGNADNQSFESAILRYQTYMGLPVTGKLDSHTTSQILLPRCGVPDVLEHSEPNSTSSIHVRRNYVYFPGKPRWERGSPIVLSYAFSRRNTITYIKAHDIRRAFSRAFSRWASVIPVRFVETKRYGLADIKIGFYGGDHGDGQPFDGVLGVLAHSFSPENGRLHLDNAETWAIDFDEEESPVAVDLESIAVHEIGHILGLGHSSVKEAVMYPSLKPRDTKLELAMDDVAGVQSLYGSNPSFRSGTSLESYASANAGNEPYATKRWPWFIISLSILSCLSS